MVGNMEEKRKALYDALSGEYNLGTYEDFTTKLNDESKRRALYDAASQDYDLGTYEDYSKKLGFGPTYQESLDAFRAEHGSWLNDFEARDSAETKKMVSSSRSGLYIPTENAISGEERKRYMELRKQEEALKKAWFTSDEYLAQKDADALFLSNVQKDLSRQRVEYAQANPPIKQEGLFQINPYAVRGVEADTELERFATASRLMDDAIKMHNAPSRYDDKNVFLKFGKGAGDVLSDADFWTAGLTEIADNLGVRDVLSTVQEKLGNLNDLSEEAIENILSPAEKAVLQAWAINTQEQLKRKDDLSRAYQAGQGATESLAYMAEFALTGGIGKAATEGVEQMVKWLGKKALTKVGGMTDDVAAKVLKETGEKIAQSTVGKYGVGLAESLAEAAGRTGVMPSTFRNISEKATEIETDENGNNYLVKMNDAFAKGYVDSFIENLSEGGRVNALGNLFGDVAGKIPAYKKMVDKFSHTKASELWDAFNSSGVMNTLRAGGWHGLVEEYLEEWYGNALRTLTGVDKEALKDFATVDNQIVTLTSFLPMTIFGGTVSTAQVLSANKDLEKKAAALKSALMERGYDEAQANNMIDMMRGAAPAEVSETLTPIVNSVANRNTNEAAALMKPVGEFAAAVQRWQSFNTKYNYQEQEQRDGLRAQMEENLGQFWQQDENGRQTVQRGVNEKGEVVYMLGKPSVEDVEAGVTSEVAAVTSDGRKVFVNPSEYQLEDELEMNTFLGNEIMAEKGNQEQARMIEEEEAKIAEIREAAVPGTAVNIGTAEAPMQAIVLQRNPDGVIVNTPDGQTRQMTYEEFGNYVGVNAVPMTDAQIDEHEADVLTADRAQREAALDQEYENEDAALEELSEAEDEIEQAVDSNIPLPMKADGSVDQTALWNNDPERWAQWNDEQRQDGGANSLAYVSGAIAKEQAKIAELQAAYAAESDFDARDAIEKEIADTQARVERLTAIQQGYVAQTEAAAAPVAETQPGSTLTARMASEMTQQELNDLDESYDIILSQTRVPEEKARLLQEYLDRIAEGSTPIKVLTRDNYEDVMRAAGCPEVDITQVGVVMSQLPQGEAIAGFVSAGNIFVMADGIPSINEARVTYVHERQHVINTSRADKVREMAIALGDRANALRVLEKFVGTRGLNEYRNDSFLKLADEIIARCMEIAYTTEDFSVDLQSKGLSGSVISIIEEIDNEQRNDKSLIAARRSAHAGISQRINASQDGRDSGQVSGGLLGEEEDRSSRLSQEGTEDGSRREGTEVISEEQLNAPNSGTAQQITATDGEVLADTDGKGGVRFSIRTWNEGGRDYLAAWLANDTTLTEEEKADIVARMDEFYKNALLYSDTYAPFGTWSDAGVRYDNNGNPLMSVIKANGDYAMNLDFSLVCKKRRPLNRLLRTLVNRNAFATYTLRERELAEINWILQEHGFEVACALCFVDSKRYRVTGVADVFAALYNRLVKSLAPEGVQIAHFNYNENPNVEVVENGLDTMSDDQLNWDRFDRMLSAYKPGSVEHKVAQYLREHPEARKLVDATDFIEAEGFESVKENNPDLLKFYNMKKGTGGPKASFGDVQYLNDILKKEKSFDAEKAYAVGGVRLQSFSDFVPHMYFDYMQLFAELAAKKLPLHAYTKEVLFAKIFGLTGAKINMSLVPAVVEDGIAPGLDAEGNYAWADPVTDAEGNVIQQGQSFPYDEAMAIQQAEGYSKNCGVIAVGISDAHIEKMLDDPNIPFIIPYHKSSLNAIVARMTNIDQYKDYTNVQNTRKASGSKLDKGTKDFNFNEYLHGLGESGTPQQAAQAYLDWCRENNYKPKFSQFAYHPNYYKLLQDFNTIDLATGEYAPQGAVTMTFPTEESAFGNVETLIQQGLQEDAELEEKMEQEIDGIADQVLARLEEISKEPKMSEKQQAKKMAELADERTTKIKAKAKGPIDLIEEAKKAVAREERLAFRVISQENYEMAERMIDNLAGRPYFQRLEGEYELGKLASNYAELADIIMAIDANKAYTPVGTSILGFFAENPDMHFPLLFNDSAVSKETANAFAEELSKVNDPYALFFMRDAWRIHKTSLEQAGLGVKASSTTKYNKAIDARAEEIKAAEVKGTAFNFKKQESSLDEIDAIFKQLNKDPELALLHDKVMGVARKLGVKVSFAGKRGQTAGESLGDKVSYDYKFFNSPAVADQKKCNTITHELIHSITVYAIYLENQAPTALTDGMLEAVGILRDVYNQIARDPAFKGEYGVSDVYEMVAELSNAQFRDKLKEKNLFQRILDALKRLLGIDTVKEDSAYQVLSDTLDYIIENYDEAAFDAYALYASRNRSYGRMMIQEESLVPGHKKGQPMLSDAEMMADVSFRITKNTKATIEKWFNKAGVDAEMTEATINYLDYAFEDTTEQLCAAKWYLNGKINLPDEDEYKVRDAVKVAKQNKVDALSYASPMDILNTFGQPKSKVKPIDPDTVKEFSNKKELAEGIVVYDVQDDFEGQAAVRKIIDTHWGEDANPWCLAARTNGDLERAKDMWLHYSKYPKRIAFRNGKLLAFYASANDKTWWDRNDEPHTNIPYSVKSKEGEYEVSTNYELKEGNKKAKKVSVGKSDKKGRTAYFVGNRLESAGIQDGERNLFYSSFAAGATLSDSTYGVGRSIEIQYGPYKNVTQISFERRTKDEPTYYVRVGYGNNGVRAISFVEGARSWDIRYGINGDQIFVGRAQLNFDLTNELSDVYSGAYHMYRINDEEYEISRGREKVGIVKKGEKVTMQMLEAFGEDGAPVGALLDFINDMGWNRSDYPYPNPMDADLLRRDDEVREQIRKVENEINEIAGGRYLSSVPAIRFRVTAEQDKAYMDAVEAGDMEAAQAMVYSAAQATGYNSPRLYHGTDAEFTTFDKEFNDPGSEGFFFTNSEEMAASYGKNIKQVYLHVEDPYVIEGNGRNWNQLHTDIFSVIPEIEDQIRVHEIAMKSFLDRGKITQEQYDHFREKYYDKVNFIKDESKDSIFDIIKKYIYRWQIRNFKSMLNVERTRDFEWFLQQLDSDVNIIFKDITDFGPNSAYFYIARDVAHDVYVTTNPKNIKSADAVTYDDEGKVIPLSERFNPESSDIRFRTMRTDEQREQLFDNAKEKFGLTNNFKVAGYMLPDGSLLDFSEANDGGDPNQRTQDHREVADLIMDEGREYEYRYEYVLDFVGEGAIRMLPEYAGFQLSVPPTAEQRSRLMDYIYKYDGEVIMEITDENGGPRVYVEYNKRTSPSRIFRDMDGFFNEGIVPGIPPLRFRIANDNQAIFVSNAAKAVEGIKQEKATPEQWLKMIEKNGGLKAGEDKWMGLSDWLKASDKKTLTKAEVLDFINENMIVIEEQHYGEIDEEAATNALVKENALRLVDGLTLEDLQEQIDEHAESASRYDEEYDNPDFNLDVWLMNIMIDEYGHDFSMFYSIEDGYVDYAEMDWWDSLPSDVALEGVDGVRAINETREDYTTRGLTNLHEIALTIPTIESWGESDMVHFGDAGGGRAVAWIRFGETQIYDESAVESARRAVDEASERERAILDKRGKAESEEEYRNFYPALEEAIKAREEAVWAWSRAKDNAVRKKVLVIDEIQSKRHQEGREKGYKSDFKNSKEAQRLKAEVDRVTARLMELVNDKRENEERELTELARLDIALDNATSIAEYDAILEEQEKIRTHRENREAEELAVRAERRELAYLLDKQIDRDAVSAISAVPDAPFDKNWHELAMKRMLRYAAENGYDVIAWTKGDQQADRYDLSRDVKKISASKPTKDGERIVNIYYRDEYNDFKNLVVDKEGKVVQGDYSGNALADVIGKEMALQIMKAEESTEFKGEGLKIGGEGMRGFYDKMLPAFMNKYGKKWGVKVEDIDLPNLGKSGRTMHSVPVTEEMKVSVMEGQVMFRTIPITQEVQDEMDAISATAIVRGNYLKAPNGADTNLTPEQWAMVRTKAFKAWFGNWEKAARIQKLRNSEDASINGDEIAPVESLDKKAALEYGKKLQGFYTNKDTGASIQLQRGRKNGGVNEVLQHNYKDAEHLQSIAAIPQIIEKSIFIESTPNADVEKNPDVVEYQHFVCGLKIGDEDYTVHSLVAVDKKGDRYYDHNLTAIEKKKLLDLIESQAVEGEDFGTTPGTQPTILSTYKGKQLVSLLQVDASKVVDANGEPKVVFHGSNWRPILEEPGKATFKMRSGLMGRGAYFTDNFTNAADYAREKYEWENYKEVDEDFVSDNGYVTEAFLNIRNEDNIREYYGETYYLATDPSQIKSATDNTGEFSADNNDIRFRTKYDVNTNPTEAQKKAGNYKMGHIRLDGYNITIENPKGSVRRGTDSKGNAWENTLNNDYGYIRGTEGVDGDHIDVYLSDNPTEGNVFVIDQVNPETREFDEHKVMYGFNSAEEAREAYLANFSEGWNGLGNITEVSKDEFKKWIESSHRKTKPFSEYKSVRANEMQATDESELRYRVVSDQEALDRLNSEPTIKVYRAMQLIDGKLYPPMSAKVDGELRQPIELGQWEEAEERPDLVDEKGRFKLDKGNKSSLKARYNPYFHTSPTPLNDQFSSAQTRPELVTVEVEVPESELTSGYKAEKAKDSVGKMEWKAGVIQSKLSGTRTVILSRWDKPVRIVPDSEVADVIVDMLEERDITMPSNVVTPSLRAELEKRGVPFVETDNQGNPVEEVSFRVIGTPTDEVVTNGLQLTPAQTAEVAANIFAALPEESRKKITEGLNGNVLGLKDAILQIPTSLASKENWTDEDKQMADVVAEEMTKIAGEMTRPFSAEEGLWLLYNNLNKGTDLISQASRALVQRNLGFDADTLAKQEQAKEDVRFRTVGDATSNAQASLYNRGAVNVGTRLKESFVDMQASVEELVKAIEKRTGKVAQGFENILLALNQQPSKGLAAMESYTQKFLNPMFDEIRRIMNETNMKYEDVVRYVILKHGLERNKKLAQRDARAHYQEIYDDIISKITGMTAAQKRTYLTNAQLKEGDAKAELATLQAVDMSAMTDEEKREHKKKLAAARKAVEEAEEYLKRAQKIASLSEQEAQDELDKIFSKIENGTDSVFKEMRENDYSGISSMFYDQLGVDRKNFSTEEQYQAALMEAKKDRYSSLKDIEAAAEAEVKSFEGKTDTKELWKRINAATKETLRQQYEANMISKDQYLNLRDMFEYYVPLRGFKDNTAEDMYTYYRKPNSTGYTKPILGAEGRKTEAESPFGWIAAMAGSAIASNVKNEAKLALYYFVSNRPENGIATISKTWFVDSGEVDERGKKIFKPAYPPFSEDLSSAEGKAQYEIWQANMKELQKKGQAYEAGQRLNLGNAVVNISDANKPEHIVNVKVGGKDYTIIINGNPRAAQAINGDLNIEGTAQDYSALFGPVLRWMSSVNTSYNPEFWITNMMRDMAFTWMAVNIKEDPAYRRKFSKNYRKAFKVVSLVAKNEKGTIGDSYLEQQYKDFVKYGGVTGYTQIKDSETWEKEIDNYLSSNDPKSVKNGKVMRGMKSAFHVAHRFGESLEQVSRFAAFLTARETGKSINEAINDAKEITVNFNRKGSGKMITLEEAKYLTGKNGQPLTKLLQWMVVGLSSIAPLGRRFIMFFNAAIQGLNATYKLMKKNPQRFTGWALGYAAVGMMNAVLHAMLDDDDDYLDIPQYERRNSLMIGGNGAYFKWALPQEARAFYTLGDLAVETVMGRNPHQNFLGEALKIGTEILPVNPSEGWKAFMPSVAIPFIELALNEDYKGAPIYNEQKWLSEEEKERAAKWSNAYQGTGWTYVKIAQGLNFITGGDKHDAGRINLQPEKLEHLVQSAFGGTIRTADKFINTISAALDSEEPMTIRQTPFLNRFLTINDERFKNVHVNDVFNYYKADAEHALTLEKRYIKDRDMDSLTKLRSSDEYQWAKIYGKYKKPLKAIQEKIKVADGTAERKELMKQQDELKKRMIKEISEL